MRNWCKKLQELPSVATEWQQTTWCPDCQYYDHGTCSNPVRRDTTAACPFDDKALPVREDEPKTDQLLKPSDAACRTDPGGEPPSATLAQAIKQQIVQRTGGRIQMLEVGILDNAVVIRGSAPCYYVKQLALQAVFDVVGSPCPTRLELNVQVPRERGDVHGSLLVGVKG